jgi:hypothetical protein
MPKMTANAHIGQANTATVHTGRETFGPLELRDPYAR